MTRDEPSHQDLHDYIFFYFRGIAALMEDLPLKKLRNFGGKLGAELQALGATTVGQVIVIFHPQARQSREFEEDTQDSASGKDHRRL